MGLFEKRIRQKLAWRGDADNVLAIIEEAKQEFPIARKEQTWILAQASFPQLELNNEQKTIADIAKWFEKYFGEESSKC